MERSFACELRDSICYWCRTTRRVSNVNWVNFFPIRWVLPTSCSNYLNFQILPAGTRVASSIMTAQSEVTIMQILHRAFSNLLIACSLAAILGSFGCNTVHGMGQDIERAGEKTEDAADAVKRRL